MDIRELFSKEIVANPQQAHLYFTVTNPDTWSVFPLGTCDIFKMRKAGWDGPFSYAIDNIEYEAFCKGFQCYSSMKTFLEGLGVNLNFVITCPGCGELLELPISREGQHFRCSICSKKFIIKNNKTVLIQEIENKITSGKNNPLMAKLIDDNISMSQHQLAYFQLEKIRNSKDLLKYLRLFSIAPLSVKIATVLVIVQVLLELLFRPEPLKGQAYDYCFSACTIWLLSGVLKGYNKSRWILLAIRGFALLAIPLLYLGALNSNSSVMTDFYYEKMSCAMGTFLTSIPYVIALLLPSANKWFDGCVVDMNKLHKISEEEMKPVPHKKRVLLILIVAIIFIIIVIGKALLSAVN
jgi:hypothetical protein